jgi:hypothetical protein
VWRPLIGFDALGIFLAPILITSVAYSARREWEGKKKRHYYAHQFQPPGGVRARRPIPEYHTSEPDSKNQAGARATEIVPRSCCHFPESCPFFLAPNS